MDDDYEIVECPVCDSDAKAFICPDCGGDGSREYRDTPECWGEDCPSETNHLVECPTCQGSGGSMYCSNCSESATP